MQRGAMIQAQGVASSVCAAMPGVKDADGGCRVISGGVIHTLPDHAQQTDAQFDALVAQLRQSSLLKHPEAAERTNTDFDARKLFDMMD